MSAYIHQLFNRGYFLTNKSLQDNEYLKTTLNNWSLLQYNDLRLYFSKTTQIYISEFKNTRIFIIGFVIDPFELENNVNRIADHLLGELEKSEEHFLNYLDNLSGRFTIIVTTQDNVKIYGDTCHTKTIFYSFKDDKFIISSHATLAAKIFKLEPNPNANSVLKSKIFTGRKFLPGLISPFINLYPLTPNNCLNISKKSVERFFPREAFKMETNIDSLVLEISKILKHQSMLLTEIPNVRVSLTAGLDSRITFASFKYLNTNNVEFFTHTSLEKAAAFSEDVNIASQLCELKNYKHTVIEYSTDASQDTSDYKNVWSQNVGMNRGSMYLFKKYTDFFPENTLHIRSNVAEIARSFFKATGVPISPTRLSEMYTKSDFKNEELVIDSFKKFITVSNFSENLFFNYHYEDLFYWEHRMPMWHSWIVNEGETAFETFVPFNNRRLLKLMLSTDRKIRDSDELFIKILKKLDSELLKLPINKNILN